MAKTRLTKLAEEFKINIDEALNIAQEKLSEEMITGKGKATWINESGRSGMSNQLMRKKFNLILCYSVIHYIPKNKFFTFAKYEPCIKLFWICKFSVFTDRMFSF